MYSKFKRFCDIVLAIILLVVFIPVYFIVALLVKIQDGGPPIFKQNRVGRNGQVFLFFKFRSMPVATPNVGSHERDKLSITTFGRFIRRTNIDELPQFWNVLKGDMSFIGPRPPIPGQIELVDARRANGSLALRPGLTGLAQVNSYDGMSTEEKAKFDGLYAKELSFALDFRILLSTIVYFTKKPPTY